MGRACEHHRAVAGPAQRRLRCWCCAAGVAGREVHGVRAETGAAVEPPERSALQWMQAIQQAAVRVNYSGTVVYQAGGEMSSSRITHLFDGTQFA